MKHKIKKVIFVIGLFILFLYFLYNNFFKNFNIDIQNNAFDIQSSSKYKIIKQDKNENYDGIGQVKVENEDGFFTTFTTTDNKTYKEYKQNGNSSWNSKGYWGGTMSENGCGITAMAIILSGYNKNYSPEDLRKKYYPVLDYETINKELYNTFGIKNSDFYYDNIHLSNNSLLNHLSLDKPVLICVWNNPSNNRFTTSSHYMVLLACDNNSMVYVSNPNGGENDSKSSGWYNINEVSPYIAKALYVES